MKALTLKQPHASRVADRSKPLEIRGWATKHRGPMLICAGGNVDWEAEEREGKAIDPSLPRGVALCVVELVDCRPMRFEDEAAARCPWRPGLKAWVLQNVRAVKPFRVKGQLGTFDVPDHLIEYMEQTPSVEAA